MGQGQPQKGKEQKQRQGQDYESHKQFLQRSPHKGRPHTIVCGSARNWSPRKFRLLDESDPLPTKGTMADLDVMAAREVFIARWEDAHRPFASRPAYELAE